jgi:hypothetical protein
MIRKRGARCLHSQTLSACSSVLPGTGRAGVRHFAKTAPFSVLHTWRHYWVSSRSRGHVSPRPLRYALRVFAAQSEFRDEIPCIPAARDDRSAWRCGLSRRQAGRPRRRRYPRKLGDERPLASGTSSRGEIFPSRGDGSRHRLLLRSVAPREWCCLWWSRLLVAAGELRAVADHCSRPRDRELAAS